MEVLKWTTIEKNPCGYIALSAGEKQERKCMRILSLSSFRYTVRSVKKKSGEEPSENIAAPQSVFVEQMMDEECAFQIHSFLHNMKEPYKEVFTLRVFGELPFDKIGMLFGKSPSWARVVFYRAKTQIKEYMEEVNHE